MDYLKEKNTLLLADEFFTETPFKNDTECEELKKYFEECFSKNLTIIKSSEKFKNCWKTKFWFNN